MSTPIRYARSGDVNIAYQVTGEGPFDLVLVPGFDAGAILDEIEGFLTGTRPAAAPDRVLATVLFTDLVGSTERAHTLGDAAWAVLVRSHNDAVRRVGKSSDKPATSRVGSPCTSAPGSCRLQVPAMCS